MKLKITSFVVILTSLLIASPYTHAAFISGNIEFDTGRFADLQGLEWMPLTYTAGKSRNDIEDGFTDNFGNSWDSDDWRYATRAEAETLLNSLHDGVYNGWSNGNGAGAGWFESVFGGLGYDSGFGAARVDQSFSSGVWTNYDYSNFFYGDIGECSGNTDVSCRGLVIHADDYYTDIYQQNVDTLQNEVSYQGRTGELGYIHDYNGAGLGLTNGNSTYSNQYGSFDLGSLLVRDTPQNNGGGGIAISEPGSAAVWLVGLSALAAVRRRKLTSFLR